MRKKFSGVLFVLFFTRKKRYQKKRASVPLDRFANYVRKTIYSGVCSPPITGFPEKRTRFLGVPYNFAAPRLWFLTFALQNSPSEPRKERWLQAGARAAGSADRVDVPTLTVSYAKPSAQSNLYPGGAGHSALF